MKNNIKSTSAYKTIGEVTRLLNLIDKKTGSLQTHTLRYWESQFKQLKPSIRAGKRRYYSQKDFKIIKKIKFLLKEKGLTISGARKILDNANLDSVDENINLGVNKQNLKNSISIKKKIRNIYKITKELKDYK